MATAVDLCRGRSLDAGVNGFESRSSTECSSEVSRSSGECLLELPTNIAVDR